MSTFFKQLQDEVCCPYPQIRPWPALFRLPACFPLISSVAPNATAVPGSWDRISTNAHELEQVGHVQAVDNGESSIEQRQRESASTKHGRDHDLQGSGSLAGNHYITFITHVITCVVCRGHSNLRQVHLNEPHSHHQPCVSSTQ